MKATCPACGSQFRSQRSTARYCGDVCRKRASRENRLPEAIRRPVAAFPGGKTHLAAFPADVTLRTPRQIAGPALTASQLHCAGLPLDPDTAANVERANREARTAKPYLPMANLELSREAAMSSDRKSRGDGATMPDIPEFLRRALKAAAS